MRENFLEAGLGGGKHPVGRSRKGKQFRGRNKRGKDPGYRKRRGKIGIGGRRIFRAVI